MNARIALPFEDDKIFQHFGKATHFKIYTVTENTVTSSDVLATDGTGHEALGLWLMLQGVTLVICGGIGPGAQGALRAAGIRVFPGIEGSTDDAVQKLLSGELQAQEAPTCNHHTHGGGCGAHACAGCHNCHHVS